MSKKILNDISDYYSSKVEKFGATSKGVDWNGEESQYIRFEQLSKVIFSKSFTLLDYGCGYGEYINFLKKLNVEAQYFGLDVSSKMIEIAQSKFPEFQSTFTTELINIPKVDYTIASGIFNVRNEVKDAEWLEYFKEELIKMNEKSKKGFSFNALTSYSDKEFLKDYLYYADPLQIFDFCKRNFSKDVALLHDYNLYEFTIIVKKF